MKHIFSVLFFNIALFSFSQSDDIVDRLWGKCSKPEMTALEFNPPLNRAQFTQYDGEIIITCGSSTEIVIYPSESYSGNLIEVKKDGKVLYNFFSNGVLNYHYLCGAYKINLFPNNSNTVLLVTYPGGASGLAANMTWGILFDIDNQSCQQFSTWGMVDECFFDIDGDGIFEFICVDFGYYFEIREKQILIANIFKPDVSGQYNINTSAETNEVFILISDDLSIRRMEWKQSNVKLLKTPDVFMDANYY